MSYMENKEKYYTPKITDIKEGYEFEEWDKGVGWSKKVFSLGDVGHETIILNIDLKYIRVPYLTKEDIEREGWIFKSKTVDLWFESDLRKAISLQDFYGYKCYKLYLNYGLHDHKLKIKGDFIGAGTFDESDTLFEGKYLSINEFRYITKELLGIE